MEQLFPIGTYRGRGRWVDQNADGDYTSQYVISDGTDGAKIHTVHREFLMPDGSVLYHEHSTVTFTPAARSRLQVTIAAEKRSVSGAGYWFDNQCHYELDVSSDMHLEFTFTAEGSRIQGLGSSTNKGNFTSWREEVLRD